MRCCQCDGNCIEYFLYPPRVCPSQQQGERASERDDIIKLKLFNSGSQFVTHSGVAWGMRSNGTTFFMSKSNDRWNRHYDPQTPEFENSRPNSQPRVQPPKKLRVRPTNPPPPHPSLLPVPRAPNHPRCLKFVRSSQGNVHAYFSSDVRLVLRVCYTDDPPKRKCSSYD